MEKSVTIVPGLPYIKILVRASHLHRLVRYLYYWKLQKLRQNFYQNKRNGLVLKKQYFFVSLFLSFQCRLFPYILKFLTVVNRFFSIHLYVHFRKEFGLLFKPSKSWAIYMHTYILRHNHVKCGKASFLTARKRDVDTHIFTSRFLRLFSWHKSI